MELNYYCHVCGMSVSDEKSYVCKSCGQKYCRRCAFEHSYHCENCTEELASHSKN